MSREDELRPRKRQRLSEQAADSSTDAPPSLSDLLAWLDQEGVWLSDKLECREMRDGSGWAIFALEGADPHEIVSKIPKTSVLSTRNSSFPAFLPANTLKQIPQIALLTLCLLYELRQGVASRWYGYLQSLPRACVPIASLWDVEELFGEDGRVASEWLRRTEVARNMKRIALEGHGRNDLHLYLDATSPFFPLTPSHPAPPTRLELYHAYSLVCSRVFQIDKYHGIAMAPHADLFNHQEANHVAFEADDFVCDVCGSLRQCEHDTLVPLEHDGVELQIPDRMSHVSPTTMDVIAKDQHVDTVDMTVHRSFSGGEEVFNSYGDNHGAAKMLCEYGFIDTSDAADVYGNRGLRFDVKDVLRQDEDEDEGEGGQALPGRQDAEARRKKWQKVARRILDEAESMDLEAPAHPTRPRPPTDSTDSESWTAYAPTMPLDCTAWPIYAAQHDVSPRETLSLTSDGQISRTLMVLLVVDVLASAHVQDLDGIERITDETIYFADTVWRLHVKAEDEREMQALTPRGKVVAHHVARRVIEVLDARWAHVLRAGEKGSGEPSSVQAAFERALEDTPVDRPLTRTAIRLAQVEFLSALPTRHRWQVIRDMTAPADDEDEQDPALLAMVC